MRLLVNKILNQAYVFSEFLWFMKPHLTSISVPKTPCTLYKDFKFIQNLMIFQNNSARFPSPSLQMYMIHAILPMMANGLMLKLRSAICPTDWTTKYLLVKYLELLTAFYVRLLINVYISSK